MVRANTAEEAINLFNTYNLENNVEEMVKLYSNGSYKLYWDMMQIK